MIVYSKTKSFCCWSKQEKENASRTEKMVALNCLDKPCFTVSQTKLKIFQCHTKENLCQNDTSYLVKLISHFPKKKQYLPLPKIMFSLHSQSLWDVVKGTDPQGTIQKSLSVMMRKRGGNFHMEDQKSWRKCNFVF